MNAKGSAPVSTAVDAEPLVLTMISGYALLETNELVPVTDMYDIWGDDTDDPEEAVTAVAGPTLQGKWVAFEVPARRNLM